ncbi:MAG: TIGR04255 family protein [Alphaproteobacteria bacterium]|nr:TIGR04255 family protein [Alphaproteobacteria bacterium]
MSHMPNAPLVYTLGVVRFPRVPEFEKFTDKFFSQIRLQYPYDEKFEQGTMRAVFDGNGFSLRQEKKTIWQYLSVNKDCGFLLNDESICFHTSNYKDSKTFLGRFKFGLDRLASVPEIGIELITMLGIRYIDLVIPEDGKTLPDYLEEWVLPKESPNVGMQILEGAYLAKYKTEMGHLNFQAARNPESIIPPDLHSPFLMKNGWIKERPQHDNFAAIDTDHITQPTEPNNKFDSAEIIDTLDRLHLIPKEVFAALGTNEAKKFWRNET